MYNVLAPTWYAPELIIIHQTSSSAKAFILYPAFRFTKICTDTGGTASVIILKHEKVDTISQRCCVSSTLIIQPDGQTSYLLQGRYMQLLHCIRALETKRKCDHGGFCREDDEKKRAFKQRLTVW